jgi:hypothetical protein
MLQLRAVDPHYHARGFEADKAPERIGGQDPEQGGSLAAAGKLGDDLIEGHRTLRALALLQGDHLIPSKMWEVALRLSSHPRRALALPPDSLAPIGRHMTALKFRTHQRAR